MKRITIYFNTPAPEKTEEKLLALLGRTLPGLTAPGGLCSGMDVSIEARGFTHYTLERGKMVKEIDPSRQWSFTGESDALPVVFGHVAVHLQTMRAEEPNMDIELQYDAGDPVIYLSHKPIRKAGRPRKATAVAAKK